MKRLKLIGTGNGGMSGGKHFWGIWGTENRLSFSFLSFLFFFATPNRMWDLTFPSRDRTCAPCSGSTES